MFSQKLWDMKRVQIMQTEPVNRVSDNWASTVVVLCSMWYAFLNWVHVMMFYFGCSCRWEIESKGDSHLDISVKKLNLWKYMYIRKKNALFCFLAMLVAVASKHEREPKIPQGEKMCYDKSLFTETMIWKKRKFGKKNFKKGIERKKRGGCFLYRHIDNACVWERWTQLASRYWSNCNMLNFYCKFCEKKMRQLVSSMLVGTVFASFPKWKAFFFLHRKY